jgi:hypothetical protein
MFSIINGTCRIVLPAAFACRETGFLCFGGGFKFFLGLNSKKEYICPVDWHNLFVNNVLRKRTTKNERRGLRQYQSLSPMQ